jgi:hypothetical protein
MTGPRILFAGNFHWNAGSSHMITEYAKAADSVGCEIGVATPLSRMDAQVPAHLPIVDDVAWGTHLVIVFEGRQFLTNRQIEICEKIPRSRRLVIDPDGHWGPYIRLGRDDNASGYPRDSWATLYRSLSDVVLQPKVRGPLPDGAEYFSYFGMPAIYRMATSAPSADQHDYELQYIGSNWWRWLSLTEVITGASGARPPLARIRVCGRWWDGQTCPGHEEASQSTAGWLSRRGVEIAPSVPFGHVVSEMSRSDLTPVLIRPLLAELGLLTPRVFETLASGTMPLISTELAYLTEVYGDEFVDEKFGAQPTELIDRARRDPLHRRRLLDTVQRRVFSEFNYGQVLRQLFTFL